MPGLWGQGSGFRCTERNYICVATIAAMNKEPVPRMTEAMPRAADPRVDEILAIIARETGVEQAALRSDATIQDLGIASLDMAQTLFALESHFDVEIPVVADRAGAEFATVAELVTHVLATLDRPRPTTGNTAPGVIA